MDERSSMSEYHSRQLLSRLGEEFEGFRYNVISYLGEAKGRRTLVWDDLKIIELDKEIYIEDFSEGKLVGAILFLKRDFENEKVFFVQIRDGSGGLKPFQRVSFDISKWGYSQIYLREPSADELRFLDDIFKKVKNLAYGVGTKKNGSKRKSLVRMVSVSLKRDDE